MRQASPSSNKDMVLDKRAYYLTDAGKVCMIALLEAMTKEYVRTGVNSFTRPEIGRLCGYGRTKTIVYLKKAWALGLISPVEGEKYVFKLSYKYLQEVFKGANK